MKIPPIETPRLLLRGFAKEDALWAFRIWNDPEVGKYLPDEPMLEPDPEYIRELEELGDDEECCYLVPVLKERPGTARWHLQFFASGGRKNLRSGLLRSPGFLESGLCHGNGAGHA